MKKENKKTKKGIKLIIPIVLLLLVTIGVSFAYFTAKISGSEIATTITVSGGTMTINYAGGSAITASNIYPQSAAIVTKNFTITGNNNAAIIMKYKVTLVVQTNTFSSGALEYKLTSENTNSNGTPIPAVTTYTDIATSDILLGNGQFTAATGGNKIHTYSLTIYFLDTGTDQNTNQGKAFTGYLKTEAVQ
ncbi:MAG: hypothetical protein PHD03_01995 [Bacilli bacterium]|nr:hypothetical protein [Bacilli bacterium]MDD4407250.1 hypothetical protein [Bacilli bacterium]